MVIDYRKAYDVEMIYRDIKQKHQELKEFIQNSKMDQEDKNFFIPIVENLTDFQKERLIGAINELDNNF